MSTDDATVRALINAVDRLNGKVAALTAYIAHIPHGPVDASSVKQMAFKLTPTFAGVGGNSPVVTNEVTQTVDNLMKLPRK